MVGSKKSDKSFADNVSSIMPHKNKCWLMTGPCKGSPAGSNQVYSIENDPKATGLMKR